MSTPLRCRGERVMPTSEHRRRVTSLAPHDQTVLTATIAAVIPLPSLARRASKTRLHHQHADFEAFGDETFVQRLLL